MTSDLMLRHAAVWKIAMSGYVCSLWLVYVLCWWQFVSADLLPQLCVLSQDGPPANRPRSTLWLYCAAGVRSSDC